MDLPKVIIEDNYTDFLEGKEVEATVVSPVLDVLKGMHVMGYHHSIAANTGITVPKQKQAHYIGIEGVITQVTHPRASDHKTAKVKVVKI